MKKLLFLLFLSFASGPIFAQLPELHAQPDRRDDTIVLTLPDEGRAAWQRVAGVLVARGYTFRYSDADLLALNTDYVDLKSTPPISVFVQVTGHQLLLRGRWLSGNTLPSSSTAIRRGGLLGGTSSEWPELEAIAQALGGTAAYYNSEAE